MGTGQVDTIRIKLFESTPSCAISVCITLRLGSTYPWKNIFAQAFPMPCAADRRRIDQKTASSFSSAAIIDPADHAEKPR